MHVFIGKKNQTALSPDSIPIVNWCWTFAASLLHKLNCSLKPDTQIDKTYSESLRRDKQYNT